MFTFPVLLCTEGPLDFVKDCTAIFFLTTLDDLDESDNCSVEEQIVKIKLDMLLDRDPQFRTVFTKQAEAAKKPPSHCVSRCLKAVVDAIYWWQQRSEPQTWQDKHTFWRFPLTKSEARYLRENFEERFANVRDAVQRKEKSAEFLKYIEEEAVDDAVQDEQEQPMMILRNPKALPEVKQQLMERYESLAKRQGGLEERLEQQQEQFLTQLQAVQRQLQELQQLPQLQQPNQNQPQQPEQTQEPQQPQQGQ